MQFHMPGHHRGKNGSADGAVGSQSVSTIRLMISFTFYREKSIDCFTASSCTAVREI